MATSTTSPHGAGGGVASLEASSKCLKLTSPIIRNELRSIFSALTKRDTLPVPAFRAFLESTQGVSCSSSADWAARVFHPLHTTSTQKLLATGSPSITFDEFIAYFAAPSNHALALPDPREKDWSRPLAEYFISSSHNTYLTGHQLYGTSTTSGYKSVLRRGCRCIEIDVWDGDDGEPEVFHGYTLTKEIPFREVCRAVAKYSFSDRGTNWEGGAGEGPIIISLECHAGPVQQEKIVKIMREEWKDMLVQGIEPEDVKELPSPMQLKRKILVKVCFPNSPHSQTHKLTNPTPQSKYHPPIRPITTSPSRTFPRAPTMLPDNSSSSESELEELSKRANKKRPKSKVTRNLGALGIYCSSHHFPAKDPEPFAHATCRIPNHVFSFSEKVFAALHQNHSAAIFAHNRAHLMRVYPFGLRFSSSNADPTQFWRQGVQLVALNWQKCDQGMMLNEGMFAGEGGYVRKPRGFRPGDTEGPVRKTLDLAIEVLAAASLPMPEDDDTAKGFKPYVKIELHSDDAAGPKGKTKNRRGIECSWGGERIEFKGVPGVVDQLAFVR